MDAPPNTNGPTPSSRLTQWVETRRDKAEANWRFIDAELHRTRLLATVFLLHLRYTFGYLAFGFLVSAPIQLTTQRHEWGDQVLKSLALGLGCVLPFLLLWPFTRIAWERMRVPEFKNLELALTRWHPPLDHGAIADLCRALREIDDSGIWAPTPWGRTLPRSCVGTERDAFFSV